MNQYAWVNAFLSAAIARESNGSPDFEVISKPHILDSEGITESRTVVLDTVYTINPGEPEQTSVSIFHVVFPTDCLNPSVLKYEWLKSFLELANGIPSHDTFSRVLRELNLSHFKSVF